MSRGPSTRPSLTGGIETDAIQDASHVTGCVGRFAPEPFALDWSMPHTNRTFGLSTPALRRTACTIAAILLASCASPPPPPPPPVAVKPPPPPVVVQPPPPPPPVFQGKRSSAGDPKSYRQDAARHLYELNAGRIYKGKLKPLLYAVGVLEVDIDGRGQVLGLSWRRAPSHAPEVMAEIERTVRRAAPYPAPVRLGRVTYTDVWLWDKSGHFQLDTLTEGQL